MKVRTLSPLTLALLTSTLLMVPVIAQAAVLTVPGAPTACDAGNCDTDGVNFTGAGPLTVIDGRNIGDTAGVSVTTTADNQGVIQFAGDTTATGSIGSAALRINGIDIQTAAKTLTLGGSTFVGSGGLKFSLDGNLDLGDTVNITGNILSVNNNEGTLTFAGDSVINGTIGSATEAIKQINLGAAGKTTTLNGNTFVGAGNINFTADSTLEIGNNANLTADVDGGGFNGVIDFAGTSVVNGILGKNNALDVVNVNGGVVTQNDNWEINTLNVNKGGTLLIGAGGNSTSGDLVVNDGGTLNLSGTNGYSGDASVTLDTGSTYSVGVTGGVAPVAGLLSSLLDANVAADSTVAVRLLGGGSIPDGKLVNIIFTTGNDTINVPLVTGGTATYQLSLTTDLGADPGSQLDLTINRTPFTTNMAATSPALVGLANTLEGFTNTTNPELLALIDNLEAQPNAQALSDALWTVAPNSDGSMMAVSHHHVNQSIDSVHNRLELLRVGLNQGPQSYAAGDRQSGMGGWVQFFGEDMTQKKRHGVEGFDAWNLGLSLGFDTPLSNYAIFGAGLSYAFTDVEGRASNRNTMDINTFQGFVYGSWDVTPEIYSDTVIALGFHDYDSVRRIVVPPAGVLPGFNARAEGNYEAWSGSLWTELGYRMACRNWEITPHANFKYSHLKVNDLQEQGAGGLNLVVNYDNVAEAVLGAGVRAGYKVQTQEHTTVTPLVYAQVFHDFINDRQASTTSFAFGGASFVTPGLKPAATSGKVGVGLEVASGFEWTVDLDYNVEFKSNFFAHGGYVKVRYDW